MTLYLDIDQPAVGVHFWRIINDCLEDDNNVISSGQCSTEKEAIQEGEEELQRLQDDFDPWEM